MSYPFTQSTLFSQIVIGSSYPATQVVYAGAPQTVLLVNNDPTNTIYLSNSAAYLQLDTTKVTPLPPGSSVIFDGTLDIFAFTAPGKSATLSTFPSGVSYTQGVGIQPISQQGSFAGSGGFLTMSNPTGTYTIVPLTDVSGFASYDLNLYAFASPAGGASQGVALEIVLQWFDDMTSGIPVFEEDWWVWQGRAAASAGTNSLAGTGPMHGRYMQVTANIPAAQTGNTIFQYFNLYGSNRPVPSSDWRQNQATINPQVQNLTTTNTSQVVGTAFDNILGGVNSYSAPLNQVTFTPLGLYSGPVFLRFQTALVGANSPVLVSIENAVGGTLIAGASCPNIISTFTNDTSDHEITVLAPRAPMALITHAPASGPMSYTFQVVAQQAA
jgi:hypothetical protein